MDDEDWLLLLFCHVYGVFPTGNLEENPLGIHWAPCLWWHLGAMMSSVLQQAVNSSRNSSWLVLVSINMIVVPINARNAVLVNCLLVQSTSQSSSQQPCKVGHSWVCCDCRSPWTVLHDWESCVAALGSGIQQLGASSESKRDYQ